MKRTNKLAVEKSKSPAERNSEAEEEICLTRPTDYEALLSLAGSVKKLKMPERDSVPLEDRFVLDVRDSRDL